MSPYKTLYTPIALKLLLILMYQCTMIKCRLFFVLFCFFSIQKMDSLIQEWLLLKKTCSYLIINGIQKGEGILNLHSHILYEKNKVSRSFKFLTFSAIYSSRCSSFTKKPGDCTNYTNTVSSPFHAQRSKTFHLQEETQNHRIVQVGKDLQDHLVQQSAWPAVCFLSLFFMSLQSRRSSVSPCASFT